LIDDLDRSLLEIRARLEGHESEFLNFAPLRSDEDTGAFRRYGDAGDWYSLALLRPECTKAELIAHYEDVRIPPPRLTSGEFREIFALACGEEEAKLLDFRELAESRRFGAIDFITLKDEVETLQAAGVRKVSGFLWWRLIRYWFAYETLLLLKVEDWTSDALAQLWHVVEPYQLACGLLDDEIVTLQAQIGWQAEMLASRLSRVLRREISPRTLEANSARFIIDRVFKWTEELDADANATMAKCGGRFWSEVARELRTTPGTVADRFARQSWLPFEDVILDDAHEKTPGEWQKIVAFFPGRTCEGLRARWNRRHPGGSSRARSRWTEEATERLLKAVEESGPGWKGLASSFSGRTADALRRHYRSEREARTLQAPLDELARNDAPPLDEWAQNDAPPPPAFEPEPEPLNWQEIEVLQTLVYHAGDSEIDWGSVQWRGVSGRRTVAELRDAAHEIQEDVRRTLVNAQLLPLDLRSAQAMLEEGLLV
jgi:hypothetical protein